MEAKTPLALKEPCASSTPLSTTAKSNRLIRISSSRSNNRTVRRRSDPPADKRCSKFSNCRVRGASTEPEHPSSSNSRNRCPSKFPLKRPSAVGAPGATNNFTGQLLTPIYIRCNKFKCLKVSRRPSKLYSKDNNSQTPFLKVAMETAIR